jgi:hypothetical protein
MKARGFIYAVENGDAVKIGYAVDPVRRLSELNVGSPGRHRLVGFAPGAREHESELHSLLDRWRVRGEWFEKAGAVLHFLDLLPKANKVGPAIVRKTRPPKPSALARYMAENGVPFTDFRDRLGCSTGCLRKWMSGVRTPRPAQMAKLAELTNGAVTANDFMPAPRVHAHEGGAA